MNHVNLYSWSMFGLNSHEVAKKSDVKEMKCSMVGL